MKVAVDCLRLGGDPQFRVIASIKKSDAACGIGCRGDTSCMKAAELWGKKSGLSTGERPCQ